MKKLKWVLGVLVTVLLIQFYSVPLISCVSITSGTDDWPMSHHDPAHTGYSTSAPATTGVTILWNYTCWPSSSPVVAGNYVYVGSFCFFAPTGALVSDSIRSGRSSPAIVDGVIYVATDGNAYALDALTGAQIWESEPVSSHSSPTVVDGVVYIGSTDHNVYALNASTGAKIWNYTTGDYIRSSPAVADGVVYIGSTDYNVYALNASTGAKIWNYKTGGIVWDSPAIANEVIYIGSDDGNFYALGHPSALTPPSPVPPADSIVVPDDFYRIEEAIDNSPEGGIVFVRSGSYRVNVHIDKPLSLIGEDPQNTIISPLYQRGGTWISIDVTAANVTISGFTITDAHIGIRIRETAAKHPFQCKIIGNNIIDNFGTGLLMRGENHVVSGNNITGNSCGISVGSSNSVISGNNITGNYEFGITVSDSNVTISGNNITGNGVNIDEASEIRGGLKLSGDGLFYVHGNNITDNQKSGIMFASKCNNSIVYQNNIMRNNIGVELLNLALGESLSVGLNNTVYRNNLIDNSQQVVINKKWAYDRDNNLPFHGNGTSVVFWDNGMEGNYWSDYQTRHPYAVEVGTSGIGDTPYVIDENNIDNHPLMQSINIYATLTPPTTPPPTPPPLSEPPSDSPPKPSSDLLPIIAAIVAALVVVVLAIVLLVYRMRKKGSPRAPPPPQP
jgi:parallel beta-helix repeat protein